MKKRDPQTLDELKRFTLEEWKSIPESFIKTCGTNYIRKLKKVIELGGERLEPYHLRQIRKEAENDREIAEEDISEEKDYGENQVKDDSRDLKMKIVYNDNKLNSIRKKEIQQLKKI